MKKTLIIVGVIVALIVGAVFAGDRYLRSYATTELKDELIANGVKDPQVKFDQWFFLPTIFTKKLSGLTITAPEAKDKDVTAYRNIIVHAAELTMKDDDQVHAKDLDVDMLIDANFIKQQIGAGMGSGGEIKLDPAANQLIMTQQDDNLPVSITFSLAPGESAADQPPAIQMSLVKATVAGKELPTNFMPKEDFSQTLPIDEAPRGMKITELKVVEGGLKLHLTGKDLNIGGKG